MVLQVAIGYNNYTIYKWIEKCLLYLRPDSIYDYLTLWRKLKGIETKDIKSLFLRSNNGTNGMKNCGSGNFSRLDAARYTQSEKTAGTTKGSSIFKWIDDD